LINSGLTKERKKNLKPVRSCIVLVVAVEILPLDVIAERLDEVPVPLDVQRDVIERLGPAGKKSREFNSALDLGLATLVNALV
jgi:hypothetical protein